MKKHYKKSAREFFSMILGLAIVIGVLILVFNFVKRKNGNIDVPGVSNTKSEEENIYVVEYSDSLWKIAEQFYNSGYKWVDIAQENNLQNPDILQVGQRLVLPEKEPQKIVENKEYTVLRGDNLWDISVKLYNDGFKWVQIWEKNKYRLRSPDKLEIGMKLVVE